MNLISLEEALQSRTREVREKFKTHLSASFANIQILLNFDRQFIRGEGTKLWDLDGNEYLDFVGGYGSVNLGHNHPRLLEALRRVEQVPKIVQVSLQQLPAALAHNLAQVAPGQLTRCFFCNSGAEAVEGALKIARAATGRPGFISCERGFHGKTFGALSVSGRAKYKTPYEPLLPGCTLIPFGDLEALENALKTRDAAAFIVEPIQGEGGVILPPPGYLRAARELCARYGTLFIADEVQTGLGRTGALFGCEPEGVEPDILCLSKALGGGMVPVGAYLTTEEIWKKAYGSFDTSLLHTSTFGGYWSNTLACAAALTALQVTLEENLPARARENGAYFLEGLNRLKGAYPLLKDVRGRGLMIGIELADQGKGLLSKLSTGISERVAGDFGQVSSLVAVELLNNYRVLTVYTLNNPAVIRLQPPLTVTREELDYVLESLEQILSRRKSFLGTATAGVGGILRTRKRS
jgi:putrescine aminotransferase